MFNNTMRVGIYCNANPPVTLTSTSFNVFLRFYSDGNINGEGFNATYTEGYGNTSTNKTTVQPALTTYVRQISYCFAIEVRITFNTRSKLENEKRGVYITDT